MTTRSSGGPGAEQPGLDARVLRIRRLLGAVGVLHLALVPAGLLLDDPTSPFAPPTWAAVGVPLLVAGYQLVAAIGLRTDRRRTWGGAVVAAGLGLVNCLSLPLAAWALALLFQREVLRAFLHRGPPGTATPTPPAP